MKSYASALYEKLRAAQTIIDVYGNPVLVKPIPDLDQPGYLDPRQKEILARDGVFEKAVAEPTITQIRQGMGFPNYNLNTIELYTRYEEHEFDGNLVKWWIYTPRKPEGKKDRPCLIYLHGGGWGGGTPFAVENPCRLLCERADAVVVNVDYSLIPENPYPNGLNDCFATVCYLYEHAGEYGIDRDKIGIAGDSAGGNLSAACVVKDRMQGTRMIAYQALIYPAVTFIEGRGYRWDISQYEMAAEEKQWILPNLNLGHVDEQGKYGRLDGMYLEHVADAGDPTVSPFFYEDLGAFPRTLIAVAEYDGLRQQGEYFARLIAAAGVPVKTIRYRGMCHAFLDKLGVFPQAEDLIEEIAADVRNMGSEIL